MTTITIQKSELANAASVVQPFFTKKTPPFSCIQMRLKDKRLEMFASLGEDGSAYAAMPASFKGKDMPRWQMLDGQALVDVLALSISTSLELTFSETSLVIKETGSCATLKLIQNTGLAEDSFPKPDAAITLDGLSFAHMVRVGEAASDDIARAALTGLYIHADPEKSEITSVAADGFILSVATLRVKTHSASEDLAYKMLTWAWHIDKTALNGMTNQQFAKYGLLRLGKGEHLTRIVKGGLPRRIASKEEVLALKPDLRRPQ